jgi:hypothetical protein
MKLLKPVYNAEFKVYDCAVEGGARRIRTKEGDVWTPNLNEESDDEYINWLIDSTKGWFTKPITKEWIAPRLQYSYETTKLPAPFEGTVEWLLRGVSITKERFFIHWKVDSFKEAPKVVIEFEEEKPEQEIESVADVPEEEGETLGIGPTRRVLHKDKVLKARAKAARALFKAERMTQEYIQLYGEDTDWEDEDSGNESS